MYPFDPELLGRSVVERVEYFASKTIRHRLQMRAHEELLSTLKNYREAEVIFIVGPTGVGKTTLRQKILTDLMALEMPEIEADQSYMPILSVEAIASESGHFNWKDFYYRSLQAYSEPLIDYKAAIVNAEESAALASLINAKNRVTTELRRALESCMANRRTKVFVIDEAQHLLKIPSGKGVLNQMDTLKSLSSQTKSRLVLIGTYELLSCVGLSGQLNRRSALVHFPRYRFDIEEDLSDFGDILYTFQTHLPVREQPDLLTDLQFFYEKSAGCVGILKNWLTRTLSATLSGGSEHLTKKQFETYALSNAQLRTIATEITEGEINIRGPSDDEISSLLGIPGSRTALSASAGAHAKSQYSRRPGQRNPKRDTVGSTENAAS